MCIRDRDLPWRRPEAGPWGVMVSEFMLQQTPVNRVLPVYEQWLARWPRPADLAAEAPGEAVRAWGRLGYPRRALRLHGAAVAITERHGGDVPAEHAQLLALPGIGVPPGQIAGVLVEPGDDGGVEGRGVGRGVVCGGVSHGTPILARHGGRGVHPLRPIG